MKAAAIPAARPITMESEKSSRGIVKKKKKVSTNTLPTPVKILICESDSLSIFMLQNNDIFQC